MHSAVINISFKLKIQSKNIQYQDKHIAITRFIVNQFFEDFHYL